MSDFQPLEVVDRGGVTQSQMVKNFKKCEYRPLGVNPYSAGIDFRRQNITSVDVRL